MALKVDRGTDGLLAKILEAQKETNKLLKTQLETLREQNRKMDRLTSGVESSGAAKTKADKALLDMQRDTNKMIKKLADKDGHENDKVTPKKSYTQPPAGPMDY